MLFPGDDWVIKQLKFIRNVFLFSRVDFVHVFFLVKGLRSPKRFSQLIGLGVKIYSL